MAAEEYDGVGPGSLKAITKTPWRSSLVKSPMGVALSRHGPDRWGPWQNLDACLDKVSARGVSQGRGHSEKHLAMCLCGDLYGWKICQNTLIHLEKRLPSCTDSTCACAPTSSGTLSWPNAAPGLAATGAARARYAGDSSPRCMVRYPARSRPGLKCQISVFVPG